jgi:predicted nucleic acid-binding protein
LLAQYAAAQVLPFDQPAQVAFDTLPPACKRIGTMDRRIAAVALARNFTLLTRNTSDFALIPGLKYQDWTV